MKLIHVADIHLGSGMEAKLPKDKARTRRAELRNTFARLLDYAKQEGVRAILFAGDIFDSDTPNKGDKEYFYKKLRKCEGIDFYYLRGNHDSENSYTEDIPNLHLFGPEWVSYELEGVVISGVELGEGNTRSIYSTLSLDQSKTNLVLLHGDVKGNGKGKDALSLKSLLGKGIDYLALGHLHSFEVGPLDERGTWCYAGCLEGRGYDECGEKGFVLLDTDTGLTPTFVKFSQREVVEVVVDASSAQDDVEVEELVEARLTGQRDNLVRLILKGEMTYDGENLEEQLVTRFGHLTYHLSVKDRRHRLIRPEDYEGDLSLRGEFVRLVEGSELDEETKRQVLNYGLKLLKEGRLEV